MIYVAYFISIHQGKSVGMRRQEKGFSFDKSTWLNIVIAYEQIFAIL